MKRELTARFRRNCVTVMSLIADAYVRFSDGTARSPMLTSLTRIEKAPAWMDSYQYTIEAEAEGDFPPQMVAGPMMQTLLEGRFQLKVHRETRSDSVYELNVTKDGSKIHPAKEGPCIAADLVDLTFPSFVREDMLRDGEGMQIPVG